MTVEQTWKRTVQAEGREFDTYETFNKQGYSLSNDQINEIYERVFEISERKNLTEEQRLDAFVMALVEQGVDMDEAEEICEMYDRTAGEYFCESDDTDVPPRKDKDEDEEEEIEEEDEDDEFGDGFEDDENEDEDDVDIYEV